MGTPGKSMAVRRLSGCLLLIALVKLASSEHSGFPTWLSNNLEEFENVAVSWDNASAVPAWLKGTYFKNGPARQDFGGNLRYGNMADGWAKISKFNVDASGVRLSSKFLKTDNAPEAQPYYNQFDFPKVNPNYYGRHYCYAYGQAIVDVRRQYLVKKNVCDSTEDKIWYKEEHYSGEPIFIANPNGTSEDDGVLLVIVLDGATQLSYLLLLDGQSFETLAEARMDTLIPMSIHGSWYDEIY